MNRQAALRKTIESITSLPTLPMVADRISRLLENPQTTAEEIGKAITVDQSLASKVLKLVNSAFYGFPGKISTITHAIVILGFSTIKNIVLTTSIFEAFRRTGRSRDNFKIEDFWYHSIACGAACQSIAKHIGFEQVETCFIAGLVHDIGKTILCHYTPDEFAQIIEKSLGENRLFYDVERELFDITHAEIGSILAQRWKLPDDLRAAIEYHHTPSPSRESYTICAIVHCADILIRALDMGNGGDNQIPAISETAWKSLGLNNIALPALLESISDEVQKAAIFLQVV